MLDCCKDLNTIKEKGINFDEFVCIGLCNGADVVAVHASESSEEKFRQAVMQATSSSGHIIAVNYDRRVVKQSGMGHFSPIGAYNKQRDLVLIMDVARYKYPPHWLPVSLVFQAMLSIDSETKRDRGYFILTASPYAIDQKMILSLGIWCRLVARCNRAIVDYNYVSILENGVYLSCVDFSGVQLGRYSPRDCQTKCSRQ
jgi:glutathione gamma-glutamylcysteinyltransferase